MDLHLVPISGKVLIPADTPETAETIAQEIAESLRVELETIMKAENRAALSGTIRAGKPTAMPICSTTLERMTQQLEIPTDD